MKKVADKILEFRIFAHICCMSSDKFVLTTNTLRRWKAFIINNNIVTIKPRLAALTLTDIHRMLFARATQTYLMLGQGTKISDFIVLNELLNWNRTQNYQIIIILNKLLNCSRTQKLLQLYTPQNLKHSTIKCSWRQF